MPTPPLYHHFNAGVQHRLTFKKYIEVVSSSTKDTNQVTDKSLSSSIDDTQSVIPSHLSSLLYTCRIIPFPVINHQFHHFFHNSRTHNDSHLLMTLAPRPAAKLPCITLSVFINISNGVHIHLFSSQFIKYLPVCSNIQSQICYLRN